MPFTPFHMGPALALKAVTGRHFSVLVFGIAQVAMDVEPLVGMLRNADVTPLRPWARSNALLGVMPVGDLHVARAAAGRFGVLAWRAMGLRARRRRAAAPQSERQG